MTDNSGINGKLGPVRTYDFPATEYKNYAERAKLAETYQKDYENASQIDQSTRVIDNYKKSSEFEQLFGVATKGIVKYERISEELTAFAGHKLALSNLFGSFGNMQSKVEELNNFIDSKPDASEEDLWGKEKIVSLVNTLSNIVKDYDAIKGNMGKLVKG
jgi:hypothetical protein